MYRAVQHYKSVGIEIASNLTGINTKYLLSTCNTI